MINECSRVVRSNVFEQHDGEATRIHDDERGFVIQPLAKFSMRSNQNDTITHTKTSQDSEYIDAKLN